MNMKEYIICEPENQVIGIEEYKTCFGEPIYELIRCKDCKYCKIYYHGADSKLGMFTYSCAQYLHHVEADDYCSSAKKREVK